MSREMRHSGIEWIGEIPKEWKPCRFKNFVELRTEPSTSDRKVGLENIESESGCFINTEGKFEGNGVQFIMNDILYGKLRPYLRKVWLASFDGNAVGDFYVFRAKRETSANYIKWLFLSDGFTGAVNSSVFGAKMPRVSSDFILTLPYFLPPLSEQQKIASYLDKVCGEVDEMIALQEQMIEELKAYKQSVITEAVTKGLNPNVLMKDSGIDWIGEIPEHWEIVPIKHIKSKELNAFVDGPFGSNLKSEHFIENGDVLVVESGFITTGKFIFKEFKTISKEHFETIKRSQCKAKDIIIAKIGANYGMAGELPDLGKPSVVSGNSLKITLDNSKMLNTIFVNAMICAKNNSGFKGMVQENAQPALSLSGLNNFKLPVPPLSEQQTIASYLDTKCSEIDALIAIKQAKIEELKEYKKSVIYEYVTGKKEVV